MTAEDRAKQFCHRFGFQSGGDTERAIATAIREAVAAEREGCARTCECVLGVCSGDGTEYWEGRDAAARECVRAIRARSEA